jgi:tetratricopeptide (TPR) repeat protein
MPDKKNTDRRMTDPQAPRSTVPPKHPIRAQATPPDADAPKQFEVYEAAMRLFHARQLREARELFLLAATGEERDIAQRCRLHVAMCDRRLPPSGTEEAATAEEHYNFGIALINARKAGEAREHLEKALQLAPGTDHVHYALAIAQGQTGDFAGAYENLRRAIELDARNRQLARQDADFSAMAGQAAFQALLYPDKRSW